MLFPIIYCVVVAIVLNVILCLVARALPPSTRVTCGGALLIKNDNSYISNFIINQWLFANYMLFPIMYCVVVAIVQNVIKNRSILK